MGSNTLSKRADQWPEGAPKFVQFAEGSIVTDVDGNRWLDWTASLGPMILGYGANVMAKAGRVAASELLPLPHPLEVEVAEAIVEMCPGVEAVRLGKTGSDAVAAAVRCARAFTGRKLVLVDVGYHGWHDWFATLLSYTGGVISEVGDWTWEWNGKLQPTWLDRSAALVIEPDRYSVDDLAEIQLWANYYGTLVIWDEVICGFRMAPGGAREFYGIQPDLSCYGKAMANGMPLSAVAGSWEVMETFHHGFWSTTHAGETLSLAAAKATLGQLRDGEILAEIGRRGTWLREQLERYGAKITGYPQHLRWEFSDEVEKRRVQKVFLDHGILFNGHFFGNAAQTDEDVHFTIQAAIEALK